MTSEEAEILRDNLARLHVEPLSARLLLDREPLGCRLVGEADDEVQLMYHDQAMYRGEQLLATVAAQCDDLLANTEPGLVVFFGLGLGYHAAAIRQRTDAPIVVYEPSADLAAFVLARTTVELENVHLVIADETLASLLSRLLTGPGEVVAGTLPASREIFPAQFDTFCRRVNEALDQRELIRKTQNQFAELWVANLAANLPFLGRHPSLECLAQRFAGRPAILVGAGPSLDVNIGELLAAQGRALIIAVHSAVQPLARAGIVPDLVVVIESQPLEYYFEDVPRLAESVLLASAHTHPRHLQLGFRDTLLLNIQGVATADWMANAYGDTPLPSGGSVACTAFSALYELGCDPIALVGMDTAYGHKRGHATNSQGACCEFEFDVPRQIITNHCRTGFHKSLTYRLQLAPAWGGQGEVVTRPALATFRLWFETAAETWAASRTLINATEGGARIRGLTEMTLADFLATRCQAELPSAEVIRTGLAGAQTRDPAPLVAAVQGELAVIRKAGLAADRADQAATVALKKLQAGEFSIVQPLLDRLSGCEQDLQDLSRRTRLLNTLVGPRIEALAAEKVDGDHVARTMHSVEQSRRVSRLIAAGSRDLLARFEPVVQVMAAGEDNRKP